MSKNEHLIVVTNDDGIDSPGIRAAAEAVLPLGRVVVIAPRRQQSSTGRSHRGRPGAMLESVPFPVAGTSIEAFALEATPALSLAHGLAALSGGRLPDLVVSGINYGENLGSNTSLSGTVGAALEAAAHGVPALAVSLETSAEDQHAFLPRDWTAAMAFVRRFAVALLRGDLPAGVDILKVDIPADATPETPWALTRQSRQAYFSRRIENAHPGTPIGEGRVGCFFRPEAVEPDSDIATLAHRREVSVTPLSSDLTAHANVADLARRW